MSDPFPLPLPSPSPSPSPSSIREYRKGNWTLHETLILITAKRLNDERRYPGAASPVGGRPAEQRWKWIENYCWNNGCHRSQNQCNDKWDNLLRDYKKVRDYETRIVSATSAAGEDPTQRASATSALGNSSSPSYWTLERQDRKERNLPTNLAQEVFQALSDVLGRRATRRALPLALLPPPGPSPTVSLSPSVSASPMQTVPPVEARTGPGPGPVPAQTAGPAAQPSVSDAVDLSEPSESSDSTDDEGTERASKRRRLRRLGSSVVRSATVLARTLLACEEKRERRHRELLELEERRLQLEQQHAEMHRQGFAGLISAVNNLSGAIHSLVTDRNTHTR